jgi:hypothetical protein
VSFASARGPAFVSQAPCKSWTSLDIQVNHGGDDAIEILGCQVESG